MKKVLILAYDFPPYISVGGLRPHSWYKYFHEFGVYPIVVTRQWENKHGNHLDYIAPSKSNKIKVDETVDGMIIGAPYKPNFPNKLLLKYGKKRFVFFRRAISAYYEMLQYVFLVGPKSSIYYAADEYLSKNNVEYIIATGDPYVLFKYASLLAQKHKLPWIADYRDPWSQITNAESGVSLNRLQVLFEKRVVATADHITTVSEFFKMKINELFKDRQIEVVPNGYDPSIVENIAAIDQTSDVFSIGYVGFIYEWHPLMQFMNEFKDFVLKNGSEKIRLTFYGTNIKEQIEMSLEKEYKTISSSVKVFPKIPNEELVKELAKNNALLLFNNYSIPGTKIYEYLALKRKIVFCFSEEAAALKLKETYYPYADNDFLGGCPQERIIVETNSGIIVKDMAHLIRTLNELYSEFVLTGKVSCDSVNTDQYSRKYQVKKMVDLMGFNNK